MRLQEVREVVEGQSYTPEELCGLLELSIEDILGRFPDKLIENAGKFGIMEDNE